MNQGEEDPQASGQTLQTPPIQQTEEEMMEEASTTVIWQDVNALGKQVAADMMEADLQEGKAQGNEA